MSNEKRYFDMKSVTLKINKCATLAYHLKS